MGHDARGAHRDNRFDATTGRAPGAEERGAGERRARRAGAAASMQDHEITGACGGRRADGMRGGWPAA
ncbi:hypothetical protein, partial [Burkholderia oklahomensis]|uniref:hypothetical protein n=1 Tax=Burkholderia oklahomensis TaxID=342113 RepID=UPI00016A949A